MLHVSENADRNISTFVLKFHKIRTRKLKGFEDPSALPLFHFHIIPVDNVFFFENPGVYASLPFDFNGCINARLCRSRIARDHILGLHRIAERAVVKGYCVDNLLVDGDDPTFLDARVVEDSHCLSDIYVLVNVLMF